MQKNRIFLVVSLIFFSIIFIKMSTSFQEGYDYQKNVTITEIAGRNYLDYPFVIYDFNTSSHGNSTGADIILRNETNFDIPFGLLKTSSDMFNIGFHLNLNSGTTQKYFVAYGNSSTNFLNTTYYYNASYNIYEDFEDGDNTSYIRWAYEQGYNSGCAINSTITHTGSYSMRCLSDEEYIKANMTMIQNIGTLTNGTLTVWFYDYNFQVNITGAYYLYIIPEYTDPVTGLKNQSQRIQINNLASNCSSGCSYQYRCGQLTYLSSVSRAAGWHNTSFDYNSTGVNYSVDGVKVGSCNLGNHANNITIASGIGNASNYIYPFFVDDISWRFYQTPEPTYTISEEESNVTTTTSTTTTTIPVNYAIVNGTSFYNKTDVMINQTGWCENISDIVYLWRNFTVLGNGEGIQTINTNASSLDIGDYDFQVNSTYNDTLQSFIFSIMASTTTSTSTTSTSTTTESTIPEGWWNNSYGYRIGFNVTSVKDVSEMRELMNTPIDSSGWSPRPYNDSIVVTSGLCGDNNVEQTTQIYNITYNSNLMNNFNLVFLHNVSTSPTNYCLYYNDASVGWRTYPVSINFTLYYYSPPCNVGQTFKYQNGTSAMNAQSLGIWNATQSWFNTSLFGWWAYESWGHPNYCGSIVWDSFGDTAFNDSKHDELTSQWLSKLFGVPYGGYPSYWDTNPDLEPIYGPRFDFSHTMTIYYDDQDPWYITMNQYNFSITEFTLTGHSPLMVAFKSGGVWDSLISSVWWNDWAGYGQYDYGAGGEDSIMYFYPTQSYNMIERYDSFINVTRQITTYSKNEPVTEGAISHFWGNTPTYFGRINRTDKSYMWNGTPLDASHNYTSMCPIGEGCTYDEKAAKVTLDFDVYRVHAKKGAWFSNVVYNKSTNHNYSYTVGVGYVSNYSMLYTALEVWDAANATTLTINLGSNDLANSDGDEGETTTLNVGRHNYTLYRLVNLKDVSLDNTNDTMYVLTSPSALTFGLMETGETTTSTTTTTTSTTTTSSTSTTSTAETSTPTTASTTTTVPSIPCGQLITQFNDSTISKTLTYITNKDQYVYYSIPKGFTISDAKMTLNISGYSNYSYINQESSGSYSGTITNPTYAYDEDWSTYSSMNKLSGADYAYIYQNYTLSNIVIDWSMVTGINITNKFYAQGDNTALGRLELYIYNWDTDSWDLKFSHTDTSDILIVNTNLTSFTNYVNSNHPLMTKHYMTASGNGVQAGVVQNFEEEIHLFITPNTILLNIGDDSSTEWQFPYELNTTNYTQTTFDLKASFSSYMSSCTAVSGNCTVPVKITSPMKGTIEVNDTKIYWYPCSSEISLQINGTRGNKDLNDGNVKLYSSIITPTISSNAYLYRDGLLLSSGITPLTYESSNWKIGAYTILANWSGNGTYDSDGESWSLNINGINITSIRDEDTSSILTANITIYNQTYSISTTGTSYSSYSNSLPSGNTIISLSASGYADKTYSTVQPEAKTFIGYMLKSDEGTYIKFYVRSNSGVLSGALVKAERFINNSWQEVESKLTDDAGLARLFLDPTITYRMTVSMSGYETNTFSIMPTTDTYTITLQLLSSSAGYTNMYDTIWYKIQYTPTVMMYDIFSSNFTVEDTNSTLQYYGMMIMGNTTLIYYQNTTGDTDGGTLSSQFNVSQNNTLTLYYWFKSYGYSEVMMTKQITVYNMTGGGINKWLGDFAQSIRNETGDPNIPWALQIISVIISLGAGIGLSRIETHGYRIPSWLIAIVQLIMIGLFVYIGWLNIGYAILGGLLFIGIAFLQQYVGV